MVLKQKGAEAPAVRDAKKRKRVGFAQIDSGIEAKECIKVFLVRNQDEEGTTNGFPIDPIDLNQYFGEDGKIYGYTDLQVRIWLSCVSFLAYAEIKFSSTSNRGKGITDLKPALQNIFGESLVEKEEFLRSFSTETHYIRTIVSDGAVIQCDSSMGADNSSECHLDADSSSIEVIRMNLQSVPVQLLYSRLVPLIRLLVEGGLPIDVTDPRWEIYFVVKTQDHSRDYIIDLLGFTTVYRFYHYPDSIRLRISQILIFPLYQHQGHGRRLLESLNFVAVSGNIYDVTIEEPSEDLQFLRTCIDTHRLLAFEPIKPAIDSVVSYLKEGNLSKRTCWKSLFGPPPSIIEIARQKLKINKKQFLRCWDILIYLNLDSENQKFMENFRAFVSGCLKSDILDSDAETHGKRLVEVPNDYGHDMTFVMFWSGDSIGLDCNLGNQATQEQRLNELVDEQIKDAEAIAKKTREQQLNELVDMQIKDIEAIAKKVSLRHNI